MLAAWWHVLLTCHPAPQCATVLQVWQLSCYAATVADTVATIPAAVQAVGLQPSSTPWPLLAMLASAAAAAGLAWSSRCGAADGAARSLLGGRQREQLEQHMPPRLQALLARIGSARPGGTSPSVPTSPTSTSMGQPSVAVSVGDDAAAPWLVAWHLLLRGLWHCGLVAVPAALFVVGSLCYDVLHGAYLAGKLWCCMVHESHAGSQLSFAAVHEPSFCLKMQACFCISYTGRCESSPRCPRQGGVLLCATA